MAVAEATASNSHFAPLPLKALREMARLNRVDTARMFMAAGHGHFGSCYSCTEILTVLYFSILQVDPTDPDWADRDRFVMAKGHAAPTLYSALMRRGFFPEEWIDEYETRVGARLMTHPSRRYQPGVDVSQGALGHGLSIGVGMALAGKIDQRGYRVYVLMGDGETHEGSVWEAAASAAKYRLQNLVGIVDYNRLCVDGRLDEVMPMEPMLAKWRAFGWEAVEVDGHDILALQQSLAPARHLTDGPPRVIIAHTVKGRGVSFMEDERSWHADVITPEQYAQAISELREPLA